VLDFRILGQLEVWAGRPGPGAAQPADRVHLRGSRQERLLALLLLNVGRTVPVDRLATAVWDRDPPPTAHRQVQNLAAQLRRLLVTAGAAPDVVATERSGYRLAIAPDRVDAGRFDALVRAARADRDSDPAAALAALRAALALWRGEALEGVRGRVVETAAASWNERRLAVWEDCLGLALDSGCHAEVVAELTELSGRHPFRERLTELAMLALYRCGRQSDALEAYRRLRRRLADELGVDPTGSVTRLHDAILRRDPALAHAGDAGTDPTTPGPAIGTPPAGHRPAQLPAGVPAFAGRAAELATLDALADRATPDAPPVVCAITGTAGVGKTTLAVHWAHRAADRFPAGQLYVNLRGYGPEPAAGGPAELLRELLEALGVPARRTPEGLSARAALYRSLLGGRRMLVVLDNARDAGQVRPLLPGGPGCLVLVTSRDELAGLVAADGAHPLGLDLLPAPEATALLVGRIGAHRVAAEPAAAADIVSRCARLPLALAIVAARAATRPSFPLAALAGELPGARPGLDALSGSDAATDVRSVFAWSYQTLSPAAARLFRLFGLHPGVDVGAAAAASLAGLRPEAVRPLLAELTRAHLFVEATPGRYTCHDLLRAYAAELVREHDPGPDRRAARHRVLDHYLHTACDATLVLHPHRDRIGLAPARPGVTPEGFGAAAGALAWFAAERDVLIAAVAAAAGAGFDTHTWQLAWALAPILDRQGHWQDWIRVQEQALAAAKRLGDRTGEADAHRHLAGAHGRLGRYDAAHVHYRHALDRYAELGDRTGEGNMHLNLGWVLEQQGRMADALHATQRSLAIFRAAGLPAGEAAAGNAVGWHYARLGDYGAAIGYCQRALDLHRALDNRVGAADTLDSLGYAFHHLGDHAAAADRYRQALDLFRAAGDSYNEASVLNHLGDVHRSAGEPAAAAAAWRQALEIFERFALADADEVRAKLEPEAVSWPP
jgi:DNA-binding SARP family transcriptional activator/Tfp pilus assembly protein PilF